MMFAIEFRKALDADPAAKSALNPGLSEILYAPPSLRGEIVIRRMRHHASAYLQVNPDTYDWTEPTWLPELLKIVQLLGLIASFLLMI